MLFSVDANVEQDRDVKESEEKRVEVENKGLKANLSCARHLLNYL